MDPMDPNMGIFMSIAHQLQTETAFFRKKNIPGHFVSQGRRMVNLLVTGIPWFQKDGQNMTKWMDC